MLRGSRKDLARDWAGAVGELIASSLGRPRYLLALIFLVAVASRLLVQYGLGFYRSPEAFEYDEIARNILAGRGYVFDQFGTTWHAYATPLYSFFIAAVYAAFGASALPIGIAQSLLGGVLALSVFATGRRVGGSAVGALSGLGAATHPGLLVYAAKIHPLNSDALLAAVGVLVSLRLRERWDAQGAVLAGAVLGVAMLSRPTLAPFMFLAGMLAASRPAARVPGWRSNVVLAVMVAVLIAVPWVARNAVVVGRPTLATGVGEVLWIGNNPAATGSALTRDGITVIELQPDVLDAVWGRPELDQDGTFWDRAVAYIVEDPGRTVLADLHKVAAFWWFSDRSGLMYPAQWLIVYSAYYSLVLAFAGVGAVSLLRSGRPWSLAVILLLGLVVSAEQSIFFVEGRHRWEFEPVLLVLAAVGGIGMLRWVRQSAQAPGW